MYEVFFFNIFMGKKKKNPAEIKCKIQKQWGKVS